MGENNASIRRTPQAGRLPLIIALAVVVILNLKPVLGQVSFQNPGAFHQDMLWGGPATVSIIRDFHQTGHPPLWFPRMNLGAPYLGIYLPSVAHPFSLLAYRLEPGYSAALASLFSALLTVLFANALFRECGASAWATAAAAFLAAMTGFYPWVSYVYCIGYALPWLLAWMWSAMRVASRRDLKSWLWNVLAGAMLLIAGDAQLTVEGAYLLPAWFLLWALLSRTPIRSVISSLALLAAAAALGYIIDTVQMLPALVYFSRAVTSRTPTLADYASTFPHAAEAGLAAVLIFSRKMEQLFLPLLVPLFFGAALIHRRKNPAFFAAIIVAAVTALIVIGGRSGLAAIPFHLPMLKLFIRHYKYGVLLQGALFIGVALGFDAILEKLKEKRPPWLFLAILAAAVSLFLYPDHPSRVLALAGAIFFLMIIRRRKFILAPAALFALVLVDSGVQLWKTPFNLRHPEPDPLYREFAAQSAGQSRVQGMFPWITNATSRINPHLPVHGTGYSGEYSADSWLEYPLENLGYFLAAICPDVARIDRGVFSRVDFSTPFKSTDFITPNNRHLVNLAALRWFFLQDMALTEADVFPILSDPEYFANPRRPRAFDPFEKIMGQDSRPVLQARGEGMFHYRREFSTGDRLWTTVKWGRSPLQAAALWTTGPDGFKLRFIRAVGEKSGRVEIGAGLDPGAGEISFAVLPLGNPGDEDDSTNFAFHDPRVENPARTIRYRAGDKVMVFENIEALGRARVVHRTKKASGNDDALAIMRDPSRYHPGTETLLMSADAPSLDGPPAGSDEMAEIVESRFDSVTVRAKLASPGYLVLSDTFYPGWRAFDGGKELRIFRADLTMRAVALSKGEHEVRFVYLPADFRVGLFVTLGALLFTAGAAIKNRLDPRRQPH